MKVSLFSTCLVDLFDANIGKATVELLEYLGCEVDFPKRQTCCGQPAYNSGYIDEAKEAAKNMIKAFEHSEYVVVPSGSCAYMFHEYPHIFQDDAAWYERAVSLKNKTYELTQFIVEVLQITDVGASYDGTVTYHTSCHMSRLLKVTDHPITLLKNVKGLRYVPLPLAQNCCGFGGTFSVKMGDISGEMVDEKVRCVLETEADTLVAGDGGCIMNIRGRMNRLGNPVQVKHIVEILNHREKGISAYVNENKYSTI